MTNLILIVGLGNPGPEHQKSRHNLGFMVLDKLAKKLLPLSQTQWKKEEKANAEVVVAEKKGLVLAKPQTFMNSSGYAVKSLLIKYQIPNSNCWVVHDDLDLPLGKIKISRGGSAAGHHGVKSIMDQLEVGEFLRFRLGIGKYGEKVGRGRVEKYVLSEFDIDEQGELRMIIKKAVKAIEEALKNGAEKAMNKFN